MSPAVILGCGAGAYTSTVLASGIGSSPSLSPCVQVLVDLHVMQVALTSVSVGKRHCGP